MVQFPRLVALKSKYNTNYLRYVNEDTSPVHTFLQYSGDDILTPYTNFEFEPAKCDSSLFHIRCCYNNKYWVSWPSDHHYIVASADQKDEDTTKWTCTLFRPIYDTNHQSFRFCHVYLGFNVVLWRVGAPYGGCLRAQWSVPDRDLCDLSTVINWESLISLPKFVAFKTDIDSYLSARSINGLPYLQFASNNIEDCSIQMETFMSKDGGIRIKSKDLGKFWRRGNCNWIFADSADTTTQNPDTLFWPTKVDNNSTIVTLRNSGNDSFVKRYTYGSTRSCLNAAIKEMDQYSHLKMTELVVSRKINNVVFRPSDARTIYDETSLVLATGASTNMTDESKFVDVNLSYANTRSSTWTSSVSTKLDVKTTIETGVPMISCDGKSIDTSTKFSGEYKWGGAIITSNRRGIIYEIKIPAMSSITVTVLAENGTLEVPFSYKQCDTLVGGTTMTYFMDDGVFHSTSYCNLSYNNVITKAICDT